MSLPPTIVAIARAVSEAGGRALIVGGYVRDHLLGLESKDLDVEVYGLGPDALEDVLERFGEIVHVGRAFGVMRIKGIDVDFALPRRDSKIGAGHRGFRVAFDPELDFAEASRRRDVTVNTMAIDPLTGEILDAHGGRRDLELRVLRATDPRHFPEDPLRGLRVAQLAARFEMAPDAELTALCAGLNLSELPGERIFEELRKLLLQAQRPSLGFEFMHGTGLLKFFPELDALIGVPQDPHWHPEGDVWTHTMMALDVAAELRAGDADDLALMYGVLCHDLGKPLTTTEGEEHIRTPSHDTVGAGLARALLERLRAPGRLVDQVEVLVRYHLAPALFPAQGATRKGYRRLARKLGKADADMTLLVQVARADHWGRTTDEARRRIFPAADVFLAEARSAAVAEQAPKDVVLGRHLMARGLTPSPEFSKILERCREIQDDTGWEDPDRILDEALK